MKLLRRRYTTVCTGWGIFLHSCFKSADSRFFFFFNANHANIKAFVTSEPLTEAGSRNYLKTITGLKTLKRNLVTLKSSGKHPVNL